MQEKFDYDAFDEKVQQKYEEYEGELQQTSDKKGKQEMSKKTKFLTDYISDKKIHDTPEEREAV